MTERNVVLLVLDTVRKDYFDEHAPRTRELSEISYEWCHAPSSWTVPSHASMFTGELLCRHGVHAHNLNFQNIERGETFLSELDHTILGSSANSFLSPRFGFDHLFDEFVSLHGNEELVPGGIDSAEYLENTEKTGISKYLGYVAAARRESALTASLINATYMKLNNSLLGRPLPRIGDYGARATLSAGRKMVGGNEPFFLFANVVDAHQPHERLRGYDTDVPYRWTSREHGIWEINNADVSEYPEYLERFRELYRCSIDYLDRRIEAFVSAIESATDQPTTVVVTSDHGEELGLQGGRGLGHKVPSAPVTHVPLEIINPPESIGNVEHQTSLLDIGTLITGISNGTVPDIKRDRLPAERIGDTHPPEQRRKFWSRGIRTVYEEKKKYEWDSLGESDRYSVTRSEETIEESDVAVPDALLKEFEDGLSEFKQRASSDAKELSEEVSDNTRRRLENLGYM